MSPLRYELSFYMPEDGVLHSHRREYLKFYLYRNMFHSSLDGTRQIWLSPAISSVGPSSHENSGQC
jgi:hypothetical protein